ncbi:MAG: CRISPR-associated endonuclease Cas1 [Bacteroidetes bacterium]|nr:CRISPR-associated endonuclease Cas1 [Bacteroidota bacterium]
MPSLYLTEQGAKLKKEGQRLIVTKEDKKIADLPLIKLESVLIYGNIQISTQAMRMLLNSGVETAFFTINGKLIGRLVPLASKNNILRIEQYRKALKDDFALKIAKKLVEAKINNCIKVLLHFLSNHSDDPISSLVKDLKTWDERIKRKNKASTLLGVEGSGSMKYYDAYKRTFLSELKFNGRNRRPPQDEVNALLSFGYTLIGNEMISLVNGKGFDPYIGFYHGIHYGRPSLALDLLEPFRPEVDLFVMKLVNLRILKKEDFEERNGGIYLKKEPVKKFFVQYEKWINKLGTGGKSIRDNMKIQVSSIAKEILENSGFKTHKM